MSDYMIRGMTFGKTPYEFNGKVDEHKSRFVAKITILDPSGVSENFTYISGSKEEAKKYIKDSWFELEARVSYLQEKRL